MDFEVFISYSRKDSVIADEICRALSDVGITFFIDRKGISGGNDFVKEISTSLMNSKIILFLGSANSYQSEYTQKEITFAQNEKKHIIPYIIDNTVLPEELKFMFANLNIRNYKEHPPKTALVYDLLSQLGKKHIIEQLKNKKQAEEYYNLGKHHLKEKEYDAAFYMFSQSAKYNNSEAQYELSQLYKFGLGISKNEKLSFKWLLESESNGNARAQYALCVSYLAEQRKELAKSFCYKAANQGYAKAEFAISSIFSSGNEQEDLEWLKKAAIHGHSKAQYVYGNHLLCDGKHDEALHWFLSASKQGVGEAMKSAADMLYGGIGVNEDKDHACKLYTEAAKKGNKESQFIIAEQAFNHEQYKEALLWYQECDNVSESKYKLGYLYENGLGTETNISKAEIYYKEAAKSGHFKAQIKYCKLLDEKGFQEEAFGWWQNASSYAKSKCDTDTYRICIDCFKSSSFYNDDNCRNHFNELLKQIYSYAITLDDSIDQIFFYRLTSENGLADAQYMLGFKTQDPKEAVFWYEKSASQGHVESMYELGKLLCIEESVKNTSEGLRWLECAIQKGHTMARYYLGKFLIDEKTKTDYAVRLLKEAEELGVTQAPFVLGRQYWEKSLEYKEKRKNVYGKEFTAIEEKRRNYLLQAEQHLKLAVKVQNVDAIYLLGCCYDEMGLYKESKQFFLEAARKGHTCAMLELHDDTWTLKAANLGNVSAMYRLGCDMTYFNSISGYAVDDLRDNTKANAQMLGFVVNFEDKYGRTPRDNEIPDFLKPLREKRRKQIEDGLSWLLKGAKLGSIECLEALGDIYQKGEIVKKDLNQAVGWYEKVMKISKEHKECLCKIGDCYFEMNKLHEALAFYKEAVKKGYNKGHIRSIPPSPNDKTQNPKYLIPEIYEIFNDYVSAVRVYREYAEGGEKAAQERLGWMYEKGIGVKQDYSAALQWYVKAGSSRANRLKGISGLIVKLFRL